MIQRIVRFAAICGLLAYGAIACANDAQVVVKPEETDEIIANPNMGWETFGRTSKQDKTCRLGFHPLSVTTAGDGGKWSRSQGNSTRNSSTRC